MLLATIERLGPTFFDIFGVLAFAYIILVSHLLLKGYKLPRGFIVLLLVIGLIGFFVDIYFASSYVERSLISPNI